MTTRRGFLLGALALGAAPCAHASDATWRRLRAGGLVILMRHGTAGPGLGDPPGFRLDDCATLGPRLAGVAADCRKRLTPAPATSEGDAPTRSPL